MFSRAEIVFAKMYSVPPQSIQMRNSTVFYRPAAESVRAVGWLLSPVHQIEDCNVLHCRPLWRI